MTSLPGGPLSCRKPLWLPNLWHAEAGEGVGTASTVEAWQTGSSVPSRSARQLSEHRTTDRGPTFLSALSPTQHTSCCCLVYKRDWKIHIFNALPALRRHDLDKLARGVSFQASSHFLPLWSQILGFGDSLDFLLPAVVCVCVRVHEEKQTAQVEMKRGGTWQQFS